MQSVFETTIAWAKKQNFVLSSDSEINSTNLKAKNEFESLDTDQAVFLADSQTQGRGRYDRSWTSPPRGTSLLSTWCFRLNKPPQVPLPLRIGFALFESLFETWPKAPLSMKAPNDIYLGPKKVAGLLIESSSSKSNHYLFVGLGLNVFAPPNGLATATSLQEKVSRSEISHHWSEFLDRWTVRLKSLTAVQGDLTAIEQKKILDAMNKLPLLKEPFVRLSPQGDLYTQTQKISWQDL